MDECMGEDPAMGSLIGGQNEPHNELSRHPEGSSTGLEQATNILLIAFPLCENFATCTVTLVTL